MTDRQDVMTVEYVAKLYSQIRHLKGLLETAVDCEVTNGKSGLSAAWLKEAKQAVGWEDDAEIEHPAE